LNEQLNFKDFQGLEDVQTNIITRDNKAGFVKGDKYNTDEVSLPYRKV
jgi:hypothetical protein